MKIIKMLIKLTFFMLIILAIINLGAYIYAKTTPKLEIRNANSFLLYDKDDELFFQGTGSAEWVSLKDISSHLINATIAVEDKKFYKHHGFDYLRMIKAAYLNVKAGKIVQGASTISQQYIKNLFLDFNSTWRRKIEELWLTYELEIHYDKDEILEGYLNTINYGHGVYGIENAAKYYFNKKASKLTLAEASILAGIPKNPSRYSPLVDELEAKKRQNLVLSMMVKNNFINEQDKTKVLNEELIYIGQKTKHNLATIMYYQDAVMRELKNNPVIPQSFIKTGGLKVYTNLDIKAQTDLEESIKKNLKDNPDIQAAAVIMDPKNGKIRALVGGQDYSSSPFNRAVQSVRQVGSVMKPFLYYIALENGFTASTTFISEPTTFTFSDDKTYSPANYGDNYPNKPITLAIALAYSDNIYAVKTHLFLGTENLVEMAKRVKMKVSLSPLPSLPLGTQEINIIDLLGGYSVLANEGYTIEPHLINRVEDIHGHLLYKHEYDSELVLNKNYTYIINDLMSGCYDYNLIDYNYPTCISMAPKITKKYAIKSGTTETDLWTVGYNKDVILGVWIGYDKDKKLVTEEYQYAKNIWVDAIESYLKDMPNNWYTKPDDVVGVLIDPFSGQLATNRTKKKKILYYVKGTEPTYNNKPLESLIELP
jgi:1A family penicillin-binding protein